MLARPATVPAMRLTRSLLRSGAIAAPLFVVVFTIAGALRPGYDPMRHPVSSLALGPGGWVQTVNFLVTGALMLAFAAGSRHALRQRGGPGALWTPLLVGTYAVGLIGAGVFVTDPVSGYPPGAPDELVYTTVGTLHDVFSVPVFVALTLACFVMARHFGHHRQFGLASYSLATGVLFAAGFLLAGIGFAQTPGLVEIAGALQRVTIATGWAWLTVLAIHLLRTLDADGG